MITLPLILSFIFFILGIIHLNWVIGGTFGFAESLPTKETGERVLNPKKLDSAIVGLCLMCFSFFYLIKADLIRFDLPSWVLKYGSWLIPTVFILRSVGEFKYIGFFKKIKHTAFGQLDTKVYSPLCFFIGIIGILMQILK
ncbi:DUF3995 domain-containing protein [Flavivirga spongiicola]|uniref:DUF3995 domain-containing protein n=1 Tax=Flavivirga spongiicola TaxID=421621 RepID=A0ABU7XY67_9FLAO|nr:DUF3995 domain-containing protein [Flavivirga sp. MEBiC05379]MDO5980736.1 DUF3995 domain-containing protein [Flavivirga sp. MEBiC05379]